MSKKPCGAHVELSKNDGAKITRCACGTYHLHLTRSGVSVQLSTEAFEELAAATAEARRGLEPEPEAERARTSVVGEASVVADPPRKTPDRTGSFVSVSVPYAPAQRNPNDKKLN